VRRASSPRLSPPKEERVSILWHRREAESGLDFIMDWPPPPPDEESAGERISGTRFALWAHERHDGRFFSFFSLSSSGGEGWGEEAVLLSTPSRFEGRTF
jgi:hypothetical protein